MPFYHFFLPCSTLVLILNVRIAQGMSLGLCLCGDRNTLGRCPPCFSTITITNILICYLINIQLLNSLLPHKLLIRQSFSLHITLNIYQWRIPPSQRDPLTSTRSLWVGSLVLGAPTRVSPQAQEAVHASVADA